MDDNYYEYFIVGEAGEYSNAFLIIQQPKVGLLVLKVVLDFLDPSHQIECF